MFITANAESDAIFLPTNGAIRGWKNDEAREFVGEHIQIPVFTCDDFMMEFSVMGITKVTREQGEWAARRALEILKGRSSSDIPVARKVLKNFFTEHRVLFHYFILFLGEFAGFS